MPQTIRPNTFNDLDAADIDVPLVVGVHMDGSAQVAEDQTLVCLDHGWEYIDVDHTAEDETGMRALFDTTSSLTMLSPDQSGLARLAEALQAHAWSGARMKSSRTTRSRALNGPAEAGTTLSDTSIHPQSAKTGFEDDFAPFVSADSFHAGLDDAESHRDPENAQEQMAALFAQLAYMRDQALSMPNDDRRRDFAADVAMRFAKHLDSIDDHDA